MKVNGSDWRTYTYNTGGRLESVKDGVDNFITEATFIDSTDPNYPGRVLSVSDRITEITEIEYDVAAGDVNTAAGESVVRVTQGSGAVTDYYIRPVPGGPDKVTMVKGDCSGCGGAGEFAVMGYDAFGRLVRKQDAMGEITEYVYYPRNTAVPAVLQGRLAAKKDPTGYVTFYDGYDAQGQVTRLIDSRGVRTDFTYDALGRVLTSTVLGNCNTDFGFDLDPNCNIPLTTTYTYQATTGPLTSVTPPSGASVAVYGYGGWGRTESVSRGESGTDLKERVLYE